MDSNDDTTKRGLRHTVASQALPMVLSLIAVLISGGSLFYSAFHIEPKLMVLVPFVKLESKVGPCTGDEETGACLKTDMVLETILINDGNRPTTLLEIEMLRPTPPNSEEEPTCWSHGFYPVRGLQKPIVVEQGKTVTYTVTTSMQIPLEDHSNFRVIGDKREVDICVGFAAIDHKGRETSAKILYIGEISLSQSGEKLHVNSRYGERLNFVLIP